MKDEGGLILLCQWLLPTCVMRKLNTYGCARAIVCVVHKVSRTWEHKERGACIHTQIIPQE